MSRVESSWDMPDQTVARADEADREIRISDFALMTILPLRVVEVGGFPVNEFAMATLVGLALFRPARGGAKLPGPVVLLMGALLALLVYSGIENQGESGIDWTRRVGHVAVMAGLIWAGGTGRLSPRSMGAGLAAGLVAVVGLALAGIGGDAYPGRLTGFLGDPNAGAYFLMVLGLAGIFFADERWKVRLFVAMPVALGLVLTYSRTGIIAFAFALTWLLVGRRLGSAGGAAVAGALVWFAGNVPDSLKTVGPFSDRSGSDKLRERIIAQERVVLSDAPWYGHGPGSAKVSVRGLEFFFHNSYLATRQEGGWLALLLVLGLLAFTFLRLTPLTRLGDLSATAVQAAIIGVAVMAITLGEAFLDTPVAIVVAMGLGHALRSQPEVVPDG